MFDGFAVTNNYKVVDLLLPVLRLKKLIDYTKCLKLKGRMKMKDHIDPGVFEIFIKIQAYLDDAREYRDPEQIGEIDETRIPSYPN